MARGQRRSPSTEEDSDTDTHSDSDSPVRDKRGRGGKRDPKRRRHDSDEEEEERVSHRQDRRPESRAGGRVQEERRTGRSRRSRGSGDEKEQRAGSRNEREDRPEEASVGRRAENNDGREVGEKGEFSGGSRGRKLRNDGQDQPSAPSRAHTAAVQVRAKSPQVKLRMASPEPKVSPLFSPSPSGSREPSRSRSPSPALSPTPEQVARGKPPRATPDVRRRQRSPSPSPMDPSLRIPPRIRNERERQGEGRQVGRLLEDEMNAGRGSQDVQRHEEEDDERGPPVVDFSSDEEGGEERGSEDKAEAAISKGGKKEERREEAELPKSRGEGAREEEGEAGKKRGGRRDGDGKSGGGGEDRWEVEGGRVTGRPREREEEDEERKGQKEEGQRSQRERGADREKEEGRTEKRREKEGVEGSRERRRRREEEESGEGYDRRNGVRSREEKGRRDKGEERKRSGDRYEGEEGGREHRGEEDRDRRRGRAEERQDNEREKKEERERDGGWDSRRDRDRKEGKDEDDYRRQKWDSHRDSDRRRDEREREKNGDSRRGKARDGEREERDRRDSEDDRGKENGKMEDLSKQTETKTGDEVAPAEETKVVPTLPKRSTDLAKLQGRTGGVYIPPFKLAQMMKDVNDKHSAEYQRITWDALRKSINGLVNKVNSSNIKNILPELLGENLIRGKGLFARSCMKSQMASPAFTHVFAALVAVVNTKFPDLGELLLTRIILQFRRAFKRNDKPLLLATTRFLAHLVNQQVASEVLALELLVLLLEEPTDDSVEVAVGFTKECGAMLQEVSPTGLHVIFERFRAILHEGEIDKRVQFTIEGLFALRKAKFAGHEAVVSELDLVEQEQQITHTLSLQDEGLDQQTHLDIFKVNPNYAEEEKEYEKIKKELLGEESEEEEEEDEEGEEGDESEEESDEEPTPQQMEIMDHTETNLINLRRTIYLTIMASVDFEEAGHKLMKIKLEQGQEMELCVMLLECCSQERTYLRYYGLLGERFCLINKVFQDNFEECFVKQYSMIHRLETNKLRNVAKFFAHLLGRFALPWDIFSYIRLTEEDTSSSARIFIKILFQELSEHLGLRGLNEKLCEPSMEAAFIGVFPRDNPKNTRFAINFFTSIGLGGLTDGLREFLKNMPKLIMQQQKPPEGAGEGESESEGGSDSDSESDSSSDSDSDSESESESESESDSESEDSEAERRRRKKRRKD